MHRVLKDHSLQDINKGSKGLPKQDQWRQVGEKVYCGVLKQLKTKHVEWVLIIFSWWDNLYYEMIIFQKFIFIIWVTKTNIKIDSFQSRINIEYRMKQ